MCLSIQVGSQSGSDGTLFLPRLRPSRRRLHNRGTARPINPKVQHLCARPSGVCEPGVLQTDPCIYCRRGSTSWLLLLIRAQAEPGNDKAISSRATSFNVGAGIKPGVNTGNRDIDAIGGVTINPPFAFPRSSMLCAPQGCHSFLQTERGDRHSKAP